MGKAQPSVRKELDVSNIVTVILSELKSEEGVAEFEPGDSVDLDYAPIKVPEVNVEEGRLEDK